jgi:hypothetical protein
MQKHHTKQRLRGKTGPVPVDRGTVQSDTLSPFSVDHVHSQTAAQVATSGCQRIPFGTVAPEHQSLSSVYINLTYAGNLSTLTSTTENMHSIRPSNSAGMPPGLT